MWDPRLGPADLGTRKASEASRLVEYGLRSQSSFNCSLNVNDDRVIVHIARYALKSSHVRVVRSVVRFLRSFSTIL